MISTGRIVFNDVEDDPTQLKLDLNNDRDTCVAEGLATLVDSGLCLFFPFLYPEINIRFHAFLTPRSCGERSSCGGVLHNTGAPRGKTPSIVMFWSWMFQFISLQKYTKMV